MVDRERRANAGAHEHAIDVTEEVLERRVELERAAVAGQRVDDEVAPPRDAPVRSPRPEDRRELPAQPERELGGVVLDAVDIRSMNTAASAVAAAAPTKVARPNVKMSATNKRIQRSRLCPPRWADPGEAHRDNRSVF